MARVSISKIWYIQQIYFIFIFILNMHFFSALAHQVIIRCVYMYILYTIISYHIGNIRLSRVSDPLLSLFGTLNALKER